MVDPTDVINYNRTDRELQAFLLFGIFVAGKMAKQIEKKLELFLDAGYFYTGELEPFKIIEQSVAYVKRSGRQSNT